MEMSYLELKKVTKDFGKLAALEDINLRVEKGEILGIVGPNGSGKTTLINVISGYYRPTRGTIFFNGKKISGLRPDQIAARWASSGLSSRMCSMKGPPWWKACSSVRTSSTGQITGSLFLKPRPGKMTMKKWWAG